MIGGIRKWCGQGPNAWPVVLVGGAAYVVMAFLYPDIFWFDRLWAAALPGVATCLPYYIMNVARRSGHPRTNAVSRWTVAFIGLVALNIWAVRSFHVQERLLHETKAIGMRHITRLTIEDDSGVLLDERRPEKLLFFCQAFRRSDIASPGQGRYTTRVTVMLYTDRSFQLLMFEIDTGPPWDAFLSSDGVSWSTTTTTIRVPGFASRCVGEMIRNGFLRPASLGGAHNRASSGNPDDISGRHTQ